jgi:hypothetical protein
LIEFISETGYKASTAYTKDESEIEKMKEKFRKAGYEVFPHDFYTVEADGKKEYKINIRKKIE